ncbi:MAG: hypothetical protein Q8L65_12140 [Burkholderiales bacterium]|nr:hypothetical protein [Burkholderiales bacterium]
MNLLRYLGLNAGAAVDDDRAHTIDFAPLNGAADARQEKRRIAAARRRHGRDFVTATPVKRLRPPSLLLEDINRRAAARKPAPSGSVTPFAARRKS